MLGFEEKLWEAADTLRGSRDPGEYKHVVLGLIFLKYISDAFELRYAALQAVKNADPEDKPSELATLARAAVTKRNKIMHENVTEALGAAAEGDVHALGRGLEAAFAPLAECEMVSLVAITKADFTTGMTACRVRIFQGPKPLFDIQPREVKGSLNEPWCYLLREGKPPRRRPPTRRLPTRRCWPRWTSKGKSWRSKRPR